MLYICLKYKKADFIEIMIELFFLLEEKLKTEID